MQHKENKEKIRDDFFAKGRAAAEEARKAIAERTKAKKNLAIGAVRTKDRRRRTKDLGL